MIIKPSKFALIFTVIVATTACTPDKIGSDVQLYVPRAKPQPVNPASAIPTPAARALTNANWQQEFGVL